MWFFQGKTAEADIDWVTSYAFHEGGHAVALQEGGIRPDRMAVGDWGGVVEVRDPVGPDEFETHAICFVAGQEAQALWLEREHGYSRTDALAATSHGASSDMAQFPAYSTVSGLSEFEARQRARDLIQRNWRDIERLADKCRDRGELGRWSL